MSDTPHEMTPCQRLRQVEESIGLNEARAVEAAWQGLQPLLGTAGPAFDARMHAVALFLAQEQGDHERAALHAAEAFRQAQDCGEPAVLARVQVYAARSAWLVGDNDEAVAYLESAWRVVESSDDALLAYRCQNILGNVLNDLEQLEASIESHDRAAAIARAAGLHKPQAVAEANAAGGWVGLGNRADAAGQADAARHASERAVQASETAFRLAHSCQASTALVTAAINRAMALAQLGRVEPAEAGFEQAMALAREHGGFRIPVYAALGRARMWRKLNQPDAAQRCVDEGLALAEAAQAGQALILLLELASQIAEDRGDFELALRRHKLFHTLYKERAANRAEQRSRVLAVRLDTARAHAETARERERSLQLSRSNADLAERAQQLSHEATVDPLTGVANRRQLDRAIDIAHAESVLSGEPRCVALLDVDHFKHVNDSFSHAVGDRVLQALGALLQRHCRDQDLVARYGGEEFVLLFNGIGLAGAQLACERVRQAVQGHAWSHIAPGLAVTVSIGLTNLAEAATAAEGLARADQLLYRAKGAGRNCVMVA